MSTGSETDLAQLDAYDAFKRAMNERKQEDAYRAKGGNIIGAFMSNFKSEQIEDDPLTSYDQKSKTNVAYVGDVFMNGKQDITQDGIAGNYIDERAMLYLTKRMAKIFFRTPESRNKVVKFANADDEKRLMHDFAVLNWYFNSQCKTDLSAVMFTIGVRFSLCMHGFLGSAQSRFVKKNEVIIIKDDAVEAIYSEADKQFDKMQ